MSEIVTVRTIDQLRALETGMEAVVIGNFLGYGSSAEFNPELAKKSDQYKVVKTCQLELSDGKSVSVALEDKSLPVPTNDTLRYREDADTPLSGHPVSRSDAIAAQAKVEVITDPHSGQRLTRLIGRSSNVRPAFLS